MYQIQEASYFGVAQEAAIFVNGVYLMTGKGKLFVSCIRVVILANTVKTIILMSVIIITLTM